MIMQAVDRGASFGQGQGLCCLRKVDPELTSPRHDMIIDISVIGLFVVVGLLVEETYDRG
jgi:hypothetical protein